MARSWVGLRILACFPCMVAPPSPRSPYSYDNRYYEQEFYQCAAVSRQIVRQDRSTPGLIHKELLTGKCPCKGAGPQGEALRHHGDGRVRQLSRKEYFNRE